MVKGVNIEMVPLDEDHVRAKITWSEQDGGKLVVEVTVKNMSLADTGRADQTQALTSIVTSLIANAPGHNQSVDVSYFAQTPDGQRR